MEKEVTPEELMKLWLLSVREDLTRNDDPWRPWFDKAFGFVVRAETEEQARQFAHDNAGEENLGEFLGKKTADTKEPWKDSKYSTCVEVTQDGQVGVVLRDFQAT